MEWEVVKWLVGIIELFVMGWVTILYTDVKKAKEDISSHRLHIAENYTTKSESTRAYDTLSKNLESLLAVMTSRFDKMDSKLDSKMDKGE